MSQELYKPIPYTEWMIEADKVVQEEIQQHGWSPSPDSIMRRAHDYVLRVEQNVHGGLGSIYVQDGWQRAMRVRKG